MQTKLRLFFSLFVACLLWTSLTSAAIPKAGLKKLGQRPKAGYIGMASWYGVQHQGRKMANGQRFDRRKLTAASWYFPLGTLIRVVNVKSEESVIVKITDRGPNRRLHRILDLSEAAATDLDYIQDGLTHVMVIPMLSVETQAAEFTSGLIKPEETTEYVAALAKM